MLGWLKGKLSSLFENYWNIGFITNVNPLQATFEDIRWVKSNYKLGWFADPFILRASDTEIVLLVEEFFYANRRGRISKLVIDRKSNTLLHVKPVLELPTHLSFPVILRHNDHIYIYPENSESGALNLYQYNEEDDTCVLVSELVHEPLTDAIMADIAGKHYLLATKMPTPNGQIMSVYQSDDKIGKYSFVKEVRFPDNTARNGGYVLVDGDKYIKVSQECNDYYGKGLVFYQFNADIQGFTPITTLYPKGLKIIGIHTLNQYQQNLTVVDGKIYFHWILVPLLRKVKRFFLG